MNANTELLKYFYIDIASIITEYIEDDWNFYKIQHHISYTRILQGLNTPIFTPGIHVNNSLYYIAFCLQKITDNIIEPINTSIPPISVCLCDQFFIVLFERHFEIYNKEFKRTYLYAIHNLYNPTLCCYGSYIYLAGREWEELWHLDKKPRGQIVKLTFNNSGELYGVKCIKQASCVKVLACNINFLCVKIGNKVVIYHADTLFKVASINIGMKIYDGIIKANNLILRSRGNNQIKINLLDFKKTNLRPLQLSELSSKPLVAKLR
jgi:hypothetical protein